MTDEKLFKAVSYVKEANSIALVCHVNPDGDAVGSTLAIFGALKKLGKNVACFCDDYPSQKFAFMQNYEVFNSQSEKKFDLGVAIDCSDEARTGVSGKYIKNAKNKLTIDHHKSNQSSNGYVLCEVTASATAELAYDFIEAMEKQFEISLMDAKIAECLFVGLVTDSGAFSFSNVTKKTHQTAASLLNYEFNASDIIYNMITARSKPVFDLTVTVLNKAKFYLNNQLGIITFKKEDFEATATSSSDTEGIINNLINIRDVKIAVALTEESEKHFKVSFRTKAPIDAAECVSMFGGGGHSRAAGCRISGYYEDVIDKILKVARDRLD